MSAISVRVRMALVAALAAVGLGMLLLAGGSGGSRPYRVDAIFDAATGLGPQQVVKIAGAKVGTVTGLSLTAGDKARVEMSIEPGFGPFRADASCEIEPEGIISENFVECSPGTPSSPPLAADGSGTPTVPVNHTAEPVTLQDLFDIWTVPTSQRLGVLLDELGIGVSGQSDDIAAILDRANPALADAQQAIGLVNAQRRQLLTLLDAADPVVSDLAAHDRSVQRFIDASARLTQITADHAGALSSDIAHLPALLASARPALVELEQLGGSTVPLLEQLRHSAGALRTVTEQLPAFSGQAVPTLVALSPSLARTTTALSDGRPTLAVLARFARDADPAGESLDQLLVSLRDSGTFESLLRGFYNGAALTSHYDSSSHVIFADLLASPCMIYATTPSSGCDAHLNGTADVPGEADSRRPGAASADQTTRPGGSSRAGTSGTAAGTTTSSSSTTQTTSTTRTSAPVRGVLTFPTLTHTAPASAAPVLSQLLQYLLK